LNHYHGVQVMEPIHPWHTAARVACQDVLQLLVRGGRRYVDSHLWMMSSVRSLVASPMIERDRRKYLSKRSNGSP